MSTIFDVEKYSGVSRSTISRYLNNKPVTADNKVKIEKAILELNYKKNPLASGLKSNKTNVVGIVLPDITDPFFPPIVKQLERKLREYGFRTLFNNYGNDSQIEIEQVEVLINQRVDGLIIATSAADGKHINACIEAGVPTVMVDRLLDDVNCDSVTVDNYAATYDAISLAIRKGHKKIGIVRGQTNIYSDIIRYQAFIDALNDHDIEIREEYIGHSDDLLIHDSKRQFMRLLNQKDAPTLIFCPNVYLALGAFEARLEFGLSIPDEVSVLTFDHLPSFPHFSFLECIQPGFASIRQPLELIAETTADLLIKRMNDGINAYAPIRKELKTTLINMESIKDLTAQK